MGEWIAIAQWQDCAKMTRPGIVFEIRNADGEVLITPCLQTLPELPPNWKSPALQFRAVVEAKPAHSAPIPAPRKP